MKLGCAILAVFGFFAALIVWIIVVGVRLNSEIDKFTENEPATLPVLEPRPEQVDAVKGKLRELSEAAKAKMGVEVAFTAEDLNVLIASEPMLADHRGNTWVESITPQHLKVQMTRPLRRGFTGSRYLNGNYFFYPENLGNGWQLTLRDLEVPGKPVPPQFVQIFSESRMFRFDPENPDFKPVLEQLTSMTLEDGTAVVRTWEGEPPTESK